VQQLRRPRAPVQAVILSKFTPPSHLKTPPGVAEIGLPPMIEILAGDRQLARARRETGIPPSRSWRSHATRAVASLRNLMHRQYDGHNENEAGQKA